MTDTRPSERLNGREKKEKTRAEPNTKVNGRREAERGREEKTDKQPKQPDKHAGANTPKGQTTRTRARTEREKEREREKETDDNDRHRQTRHQPDNSSQQHANLSAVCECDSA